MKVILTEDVVGTGKAGEVRQVADGFARNFLLPRQLAQPAQPKAEAQIRAQKDRQRSRVAAEVVAARELGAKLSATQVEIAARAECGSPVAPDGDEGITAVLALCRVLEQVSEEGVGCLAQQRG